MSGKTNPFDNNAVQIVKTSKATANPTATVVQKGSDLRTGKK